jgi:hypothetical protein
MIALRVAPPGSRNSEIIVAALVMEASAVGAAAGAAAPGSFATPGSAVFARLPFAIFLAMCSSPF